MARPNKVAGVRSLADSAKNATTVILTECHDPDVEQVKELRLTPSGEARYAVAKNELSKLTFKEAGVEGLDEYPIGPTAIAFVEHDGDPVTTVKVTSKLAKESPALAVKDGLIDGDVMDTEGVRKLTLLESREIPLAKSAEVLKVLMYRAVAVMVAPASETVCIIGTLHEKQAKAA